MRGQPGAPADRQCPVLHLQANEGSRLSSRHCNLYCPHFPLMIHGQDASIQTSWAHALQLWIMHAHGLLRDRSTVFSDPSHTTAYADSTSHESAWNSLLSSLLQNTPHTCRLHFRVAMYNFLREKDSLRATDVYPRFSLNLSCSIPQPTHTYKAYAHA